MTPDEHVDQALQLLGNTTVTDDAAAVVHALLSLRPAPVVAPAVPGVWLDNDGDVWADAPDGGMVMLDREAAEWERPGLHTRAGVERKYGPLRPMPAPGAPS